MVRLSVKTLSFSLTGERETVASFKSGIFSQRSFVWNELDLRKFEGMGQMIYGIKNH